METKTFVCTSDEETRQKLLAEGLIEVKNSNGIFTFLSDGREKFSVDDKKITMTNKLCI